MNNRAKQISATIRDFMEIVLCYLFISCNLLVECRLTAKPENAEAVVGKRVQLNCSTSEPYYVLWDHNPVGSFSRNYVFYSGVVVVPYNERFQIDRDNNTGRYNLIIPSVRLEDAGVYRCMDKVGHGEHAGVELIVLESAPRCQVAKVASCAEEAQDIEVSCTVNFKGNLVPDVNCFGDDKSDSQQQMTEKQTNMVSYYFRSTSKWPMKCRTSVSFIETEVNTTYVTGSSESANLNRSEIVRCEASSSSSAQCSYEWVETDSAATVSFDQTLDVKQPGRYKCRATCFLNGWACIDTLLIVEMPSQQQEGNTLSVFAIAGIVTSAAVVLVAFVTLILVLVICNRRRGRTGEVKDQGTPSSEDGTSSSKETPAPTKSRTGSRTGSAGMPLLESTDPLTGSSQDKSSNKDSRSQSSSSSEMPTESSSAGSADSA